MGSANLPERPKLFRVVTECLLQEEPLTPIGGGGVRVRPLALCDENELGELGEEDEDEAGDGGLPGSGLLLAAAERVQGWVSRFLSSRAEDHGPTPRKSRLSLGMGLGGRKSVAVARVPEPADPRVYGVGVR